jgi:phenylpropionate dioxygenase-like ring-hydroxylating dioxygenase large terminal subunit
MEGWIALTRTSILKPNIPTKVTLKNKNYAVWKSLSSNEIHIVPDQCRHRGASLSDGKLSNDGCVVCPYHGWKTNSSKVIQPWDGPTEYTTPEFIVKEQDGFVWARPWGLHGLHGLHNFIDPPSVPNLNINGFHSACFETEIEQCAQLIIENGIDPSHASWVHANGLGFGTVDEEPRNVKHTENTIEFDYIPNRYALTSQLFGITNTKNFHTFVVPYTTWSDVILANGKKLMTFVTLLPMTDTRTKMFVVFSQNFGVPSELFVAMGKEIVEQDRKILEAQDPSFVSKGQPGKYDAIIMSYRRALQSLIFK